MPAKLVQWGAGNIGRSFIGQIFARNGYEVVFIDIDRTLVDLLNSRRSYRVEVVSARQRTSLTINGVRAIDGRDTTAVLAEIVTADMLSLSLGKQVWPAIAETLSRGLLKRLEQRGPVPLDIIIAENIHDGATTLRKLLAPFLPDDYPFGTLVGLVQTSIGKMVPIQRGGDPLVMIAESFNTLIVDRDAFTQAIPAFKEIEAVSPIGAYVDRKLFIHNMGHAVTAYVGFHFHPEEPLLASVLQDPAVLDWVGCAMHESRDVMLAKYPKTFTASALDAYIDDLLERFANSVLGDTVHRVGRDVQRKLRCDDRLMGVMLEAERLGLPFDHIAAAYRYALSFDTVDADGKPYPADARFFQAVRKMALVDRIAFACGLALKDIPQPILSAITDTPS